MRRRVVKSKLERVWKLVKPISDYLYGYSLVSVAVIVNILTLNVLTDADESANSILLVGPPGSGKTTLLSKILQPNNAEWFPELPEKFFESQLLDEADSVFQRKVWVQDDLITSFRGTNRKQLEQLMGFFNTFLTKGSYSRKGKKKTGKILCVFGYAKSHYTKNKELMLLSTFNDRFASIIYDLDEAAKRRILEFRSGTPTKRSVLPKVRLPLKDQEVDVQIRRDLYPEINRLALELDKRGVMTSVRAQTFIKNFVKASADVNGRKRVVEDDLMLFKLLLPLHFDEKPNSARASFATGDVKVREAILEASMQGKKISGRELKDGVIEGTGFTERTVQGLLSNLRDKRVVHFEKVGGKGSGYDYQYWL